LILTTLAKRGNGKAKFQMIQSSHLPINQLNCIVIGITLRSFRFHSKSLRFQL